MVQRDRQCSQRVRGPVGPGGGTAKSPGPEGDGKMQSTPVLVEDGGPCKVRHFSVGKAGDYRGLWGTVGDYGGLRGTTGDC